MYPEKASSFLQKAENIFRDEIEAPYSRVIDRERGAYYKPTVHRLRLANASAARCIKSVAEARALAEVVHRYKTHSEPTYRLLLSLLSITFVQW